jgi:hypothetical protein
MPPRYSYWTIIAGGLPTAFRAAEQTDLLPTFKRLQEKHPDAEMKWFARGKLWESPAAAREDTERRRQAPSAPTDRIRGRGESRRPADGSRKPSSFRKPAAFREERGRDWRPGGEHRDPRQPFKDAKKERNQERRKQRFERKQRSDRPPREKPHGDPLRAEVEPRNRPWRPKGPPRGGHDGRKEEREPYARKDERGGPYSDRRPKSFSPKPRSGDGGRRPPSRGPKGPRR